MHRSCTTAPACSPERAQRTCAAPRRRAVSSGAGPRGRRRGDHHQHERLGRGIRDGDLRTSGNQHGPPLLEPLTLAIHHEDGLAGDDREDRVRLVVGDGAEGLVPVQAGHLSPQAAGFEERLARRAIGVEPDRVTQVTSLHERKPTVAHERRQRHSGLQEGRPVPFALSGTLSPGLLPGLRPPGFLHSGSGGGASVPTFETSTSAPADVAADLLIVPFFRGREAGPGFADVARALGIDLVAVLEENHVLGKVGESFTMPTFGRIPASNVMLLGLGPKSAAGPAEIRRATLKVGRRAGQSRVVATTVHRVGRSTEESSRALAEGLTLGAYKFDRYKERPIDEDSKERPALKRVVALGGRDQAAVQAGLRRGQIYGESA